MQFKSFCRVLFRDFIVWELEISVRLFSSELAYSSFPPPPPPTRHTGACSGFSSLFICTLLHLYQALRPCVHRSTLHNALTLLRPLLYQNPSHDTSLLAFHSSYIIFFVLTKSSSTFLHYYITLAKDPQLETLHRLLQSPIGPNSPLFYCTRQNIPPLPWEL